MSDVSHDSETLATGQQVITACALIHKVDKGVVKVFLPKRATTKKFLPGVFEIPGGHIDYREDLVDGLKREIDEEFGVNIQVGSPFAAFTYINDVKQSHSIEVMYFATLLDDESRIKINPDDHSEYMWVSLDDIQKAYTNQKGADDQEFVCLRRGLGLLNGDLLDFGT